MRDMQNELTIDVIKIWKEFFYITRESFIKKLYSDIMHY